MGQFGNTATAMVLSHVIFWSAWPIILKGEDQDPCQQECIYCCCGIPWNILITLFIDKQMNNTMPYFRDFSQYSLNSSGFSCQSVGSSRVLNCLFGSLIEMSGIWAADSHSFSATHVTSYFATGVYTTQIINVSYNNSRIIICTVFSLIIPGTQTSATF